MTSVNANVPPPAMGELRLVRTRLGLTQQQMADKLGVSTRAVEEYESGRNATPLSIGLALHIISMEFALTRQNPMLTTEATGRLTDRLAALRTEKFLGDRVNGWAISIGTRNVAGVGEATYSWAVAADQAEDALAIMAKSQPSPTEGFQVLARLSQYTIARLGLKRGEACPL